MKTKNNTFVRRITLILKKDSEKHFIYPSVRKMQNFLRNKAKHYFKNGYFITIRVLYKDGATNSGTYDKIEGLKWALQAFVRDYLKD